MTTTGKMRAARVWAPRIREELREDGTRLIWQEEELGAYPARLSDRIVHWAEVAPDRTWMAERDASGAWARVSYGELHDLMQRVGSWLMALDLSVERPLMILSGNSVAHAVVALAAQYIGVPSAAVAPAYSLLGEGHGKLRDIVGQVTPGAVFADDGARFAPAIADVFDPDVRVIVVEGDVPGFACTRWSEVIATQANPAVEQARLAVGPDTIAKFLFTSGTTGSPKAVIQTQGMMCSNMEMVLDCYRFLGDAPPVLVDWAPWNHVASGSKVFNIAIYNGGTFYIDAGKPTPQGMAETIRNLAEVSPTWYFNVPSGFEMLCEAMQESAALRESFFARLQLIMYAGAGMGSHTWRQLNELSEATVGARTLMGSGLGATETAPFAMFGTAPQDEPGNVGVPARGVVLKLVPVEGKLEARFKGPNVTPGYWRSPDLTARAFDEEGFYNMGDALRYAVPGDAAAGFLFDGRTAENFKLQTGTWVAVGAMRAKLVDAMQGLVRDAVIAGENQHELGALLVPFRPALERLVEGGAQMDDATLFAHPQVRARIEALLGDLARSATGSSGRIARALLLDVPLEMSRGEVTDKGSVNQRAVLANRSDLVRQLYDGGPKVLFPAAAARTTEPAGERA
ncbi:feruloyl-CoA synthase [Pseudooceanicola sediminis]|uniref:Feruloyl-CoA synthase n=1 Tax=Pseudooceanicola sediminis TaxID=2211117 RepID=A0A399J9L3_9RHOB|nr:feruloyl-CoA synthase [Pseudooceanicola sediminis]KAA2314700.1 feruloyl-CoA synthase [Puniceibacterium sp. HSS470]RII39346.1 feruloyl-CoA synthase [Pseudooceanicola sediminis]|tara:strand:- start:195243 stop:197123 length:1881 start_codon:yes stop_codon:yes gene_type:complete